MSMTTKPNLTPAQRAALRLAVRRDGEWHGRIVPSGRPSGFLRRLVGTGAVAWRYILDDSRRDALAQEIRGFVIEAEATLALGDWRKALQVLQRAQGLELTRNERALYVTDLGREAAS